MKTPSQKNLRLYELYDKLSTLGVRFISKINLKGSWYYCFELADLELAETLKFFPRPCWKVIGGRIYIPSEDMICFLVNCLSNREKMTVTELPTGPGEGKKITVDCVVTKSEAFDLLVKHGANHLYPSWGSISGYRLEDLI